LDSVGACCKTDQNYVKEAILTFENLQRPAETSIDISTSNVGAHTPTIALLTVSLAACGGGGSDSPSATTSSNAANATTGNTPPIDSTQATADPNTLSPPANPTGFKFKSAADRSQAACFLQQAQFSSTQAEITQLRGANGDSTYADWLNKQYALPLSEKAWDWLDRRGYYSYDLASAFYNNTFSVDFALWKQLMAAPDAMRKRAALALSEFFVVSVNGTAFTWQNFGYARWWDMLCEKAFGNFRDLLEEVTLNPAMGNYLNTKGNKKENATGQVPDENYARELMQLFTLGLYKLNPDGTEVKDGTGKSIDTYSQGDVTNLARVFTGYNFDTSDGVRTTVARTDGTTFTVVSRDFAAKRMSYLASDHSTLEAKFLGATVSANTPGPAALKIALDTLFNHPNVGPFFAKQMIQRLVTSNPTAAYVGRVAAAFKDNGAGVRGDLKAVWSAILLDDEARNPMNASNPNYGKLREPMVRFIQWARTFGFTSATDSWKIVDTSNTSSRLAQSPLRSASVFNFFRPGFVPPNTALSASKSVAPEFQIVNETTVSGYLNFMLTTIRNGFSVRNPAVPQSVTDTTFPLVLDMQAAYTEELALVLDAAALVSHVNTVLCAGRISVANMKLMSDALNGTALTAASTDSQKLDRVAGAVLMAMACSEYLVQK
jgi:uncharacterized protein (DUF1800 family)